MRVAGEKTTVIIADPPWPHANGSRTNSGKSPKYPLMNLREIAALGAQCGASLGTTLCFTFGLQVRIFPVQSQR